MPPLIIALKFAANNQLVGGEMTETTKCGTSSPHDATMGESSSLQELHGQKTVQQRAALRRGGIVLHVAAGVHRQLC